MAHDFIASPILLLGKRQRDEGGDQKVSLGTHEVGEGKGADPKLDVRETEQRPGSVRRRGAEVLAGAQQKLKPKDEAVSRSGAFVVGRGEGARV